MTLGERIKQLRKGKYSQEKLAELLNVNNNTISKWENGTQIPRKKRVIEIAKILDTTPAYLLGETNSNGTENQSRQLEIPLLSENQSNNLDDKAEKLVYEWGGHKLVLPNTPETRTMFEQIVMVSMKHGAPA